MENSALIIFVRNPVWGKVKTRLAQSIGNEKALLIYTYLLEHTYSITKNLTCDKFIFYADYIDEKDIWDNDIYRKETQQGDDLGRRMQHAFLKLFNMGYEKIIIIGSDCYQLTEIEIINAFGKLHSGIVVIGPAGDGGYYLLGMQKLIQEIFHHISWSTSGVLMETIVVLKALNRPYLLLPVLTDIDDEADLNVGLRIKAGLQTD